MAQLGDLPFTRKNWSLAIAGLVVIVLGYVFLRIPPAEGFLSLTLAPVTLSDRLLRADSHGNLGPGPANGRGRRG